MPLPDDREAVVRLRRKDVLPRVAAEAGVPSPGTVLADGDDAVRDAGLRAPMVVKAVEGQEFALTFGQKALVAESVDEALAVAREASERGFQTIVQEIVPDSHERIYSLLTYVARDGRPLVTLVGRKVRQGPLRFGTSAVFEVDYEPTVLEQGLRLLQTAGLHGHRPRRVRAGPAGRRVPSARGQHAPPGLGRAGREPPPRSPEDRLRRPVRAGGRLRCRRSGTS